MNAARAAAFYLGLFGSLLVWGLVMPLCLPFPHRVRYAVLSGWARLCLTWLRITCGLGFRVEGLDNLPRGTPAVVLAKHQSAWETLALQAVLPPHTWVLKRELLQIPILGWGLALLAAVGIDRKAGRKALQQVVEEGTDRLQRGIWVVVFPEGTRTEPGAKGQYNVGGAMLAVRSGYPVVPIAHNSGEFWPRRWWVKRPGKITLAIGPVIDVSGRKAGDVNAEAEAWIETKYNEISTL